jgi:GNAT superfamily N-acetyltransferase
MIPAIVHIRLDAITAKEISEFGVPEDNMYSSIEELRKIWDKDNLLLNDFEVFVAENKSGIIGFIVFSVKGEDNIDTIVVSKKEQRKGVGRALVEYIEDLAKSRRFNLIKTDTTENSMGVAWKAYGFWIRLGYKDSGKRVSTKYGFKIIPLIKELK